MLARIAALGILIACVPSNGATQPVKTPPPTRPDAVTVQDPATPADPAIVDLDADGVAAPLVRARRAVVLGVTAEQERHHASDRAALRMINAVPRAGTVSTGP